MPGLYVHVPFCARKCRYCDFYSLPFGPDQAGRMARYLAALERELARLPADFVPDTVYIGGGTPTYLEAARLQRLLELVAARVSPAALREWTIEANPGTLTAEKVSLLRRWGVNRVSVGVQSFDQHNLGFLGRAHTPADARAAYAMLRAEGFDNLGLDLMFAIPGGGPESLAADLDAVESLAPEHVAWYALIFEPGTPLAAARSAGRVREVEDDAQRAQFDLIRRRLAQIGNRHYEISNFARPGRACRHNLLYWSGGEYIGVGPAAHSHWRGRRYGNICDLDEYCARLESGAAAPDFVEQLAPEAKARETLVMALRQLDGVAREWFQRATGYDYRQLCGPTIDRLIMDGWLAEDGERLRLTESGLFVSDAVFRELV